MPGDSSPSVLEELAALPATLHEALAPPDSGLPLDLRRSVIRAQLETVHAELVSPFPGAVSGCTVEDLTLDEMRLRVYRPTAATDGLLAAFVFIHGGGWWQGWIDSSVIDTTCRERCVGAGVVVVSVGYRKAPEHPFPAPLDDVVEALRWTHRESAALGIDPARIGIGGQSAGANLAAAAVLRNRDEGGPAIALQLLEVPVLDLTLVPASSLGSDAELEGLRECVDLYLGDTAQALLPYASPLLAADVSGLPPTHIMVAGLDPLRDDGSAYAARLSDSGVDATLTSYPQHLHATPILSVLTEGRRWRDEVIEASRKLLSAPA